MTGPARIRWRNGATEGSLLGYVGTLPSWAFQIFQSGDPAEGRKMIAQLPGMAGMVGRNQDVDVLKADAEDWLVGFVASVGARFPGADGREHPRDEPACKCCVDNECECADEPEPEPPPGDPGDEIDDEGGASEYRYAMTEYDRER
jgi:hypothetical protein